jgi:hypothetical protein
MPLIPMKGIGDINLEARKCEGIRMKKAKGK